MSIKLIFDLDWTLYSENDVIDITTTTFYNSFKKKNLLNLLLKRLNYNKYIFSNGNKNHVMHVMRRMQIKSFFKNIASSDDYDNMLKPDLPKDKRFCAKHLKFYSDLSESQKNEKAINNYEILGFRRFLDSYRELFICQIDCRRQI